MHKVIILPLAKQDIKEASSWYNSRQKGLGLRFTKDVRSKTAFIKKSPYTSSIRYDNIHCAVLDVFPFMIHYSIDAAKKLILIVGVFHTSRSPEIWTKKLKI